MVLYDFGVATLTALKKFPFLSLQSTQSYVANLSKQTFDKFYWITQIFRSTMSQGTTPTNYRDTVCTDNDYFLRSKKANEHTGSTGLDPKSILFSPLPRPRTPVLQSAFNRTETITQRTPAQQQPQQHQVINHSYNQNNNSRDISNKYNNSYQSNNNSLYISIVTTSLWEMYTSNPIKVKIRVR